MAFTRVLYTSLAVWGLPGPAPAPLVETGTVSDTASITVSETSEVIAFAALAATDTASITLTESTAVDATDSYIDRTELRATSLPGPYTEIGSKTVVTLFPVEVSDTAFLQVTESPIGGQELIATDVARLTLSESTSLVNRIDAVDTAGLRVTEAVILGITGVTEQSVTDTTSISVSESVALSITVDVSDTASLTLSGESVTVDVSTEAIDVSDTASITLNESASVDAFLGSVDISVGDTATLTVSDVATVQRLNRISEIRFYPLRQNITFN